MKLWSQNERKCWVNFWKPWKSLTPQHIKTFSSESFAATNFPWFHVDLISVWASDSLQFLLTNCIVSLQLRRKTVFVQNSENFWYFDFDKKVDFKLNCLFSIVYWLQLISENLHTLDVFMAKAVNNWKIIFCNYENSMCRKISLQMRSS